MALVSCAICGDRVSTKALACPHCGAPAAAALSTSEHGADHGAPRSEAPSVNIYIENEGQQVGPITVDEVNRRMVAGESKPTTLAWIEGWKDWRTVSCVPGVVSPVDPTTPNSPSKATKPKSSDWIKTTLLAGAMLAAVLTKPDATAHIAKLKSADVDPRWRMTYDKGPFWSHGRINGQTATYGIYGMVFVVKLPYGNPPPDSDHMRPGEFPLGAPPPWTQSTQSSWTKILRL